MVKAHLNKKRIRLERIKEERMIAEKQNNEDGQKELMEEVKETKRSENDTQPKNKVDVLKNERTEKENNGEDTRKTQDSDERESSIHAIQSETGHQKAKNDIKDDKDGSPKVDQNNDVTTRDSNLNKLTARTITTTVDPKRDQCVLNSTDYYLPSGAREQRIKYKGLIRIKEDPSLHKDKTSNNGTSVKSRNYQDRSNLKDDSGDGNLKGSDGKVRMTTGVKLGPVRHRKARVLEVRKDTRGEPRVRERSSEELIKGSRQQLNNPQSQRETSDDNHGGIITNLSNDTVTAEAQPNEACANNTIKPVTEDPNKRTICVVTSLSHSKQSDNRSDRQIGLITLRVTSRHKAKKPKSLRPIISLPVIAENGERGPLRNLLQDPKDEDKDVRNMRELTQPSGDGQIVEVGEKINAPSFLPPIKLTNGKFEKPSDINVNKDDGILPRLTRSLDFVPGYQEHEEDVKTTTGSTQSLTAVEFNNLRRKKARKMRKKILDKETVTVYQKNSKGQVVPSGIPFRRNVFAPPRDHEGRIRKRLVEAEQSVARQQKQRVDTFFTQMIEAG